MVVGMTICRYKIQYEKDIMHSSMGYICLTCGTGMGDGYGDDYYHCSFFGNHLFPIYSKIKGKRYSIPHKKILAWWERRHKNEISKDDLLYRFQEHD